MRMIFICCMCKVDMPDNLKYIIDNNVEGE